MDISEFTARTEALKLQLYRTAYLYVGTESIAIDAVDEAIYLGLRALKKLRQPDYFETWMTRILINQCKKELRRQKREQPLAEWSEAEAERFNELPLKEAVLRLPTELKEVIILRYFTDYTLAQTAQTLDLPQGTVASRQRRALQLLKLDLLEEGEEDGSKAGI